MNGRIWTSDRTGARLARLAACAVAAIVALLVAAAGVTAHGPDPVFSGGRWAQNQSLQFSWRSGSVPAAVYQAAIKAAAADASSTRGSQAATFSYAAGASNLVGYGAGATCGVKGIACFTRNAPTSFTLWMREQGHRFDWGSLRWCQAYTTWPNGCYDVENIMLDEFGHVEILDHHSNLADGSDYTDAVVQELSRTKPRAGWNAHAFGRCDVASLQLQYDMQGWGARYSTCLDLATTLALSANPAAIPRGSSTTMIATLKVADVASYVPARPEPGRVAVGDPAATHVRDDRLDDGRHDGQRSESRRLHDVGQPPGPDGVPRAVRQAHRRGPPGGHLAGRRGRGRSVMVRHGPGSRRGRPIRRPTPLALHGVVADRHRGACSRSGTDASPPIGPRRPTRPRPRPRPRRRWRRNLRSSHRPSARPRSRSPSIRGCRSRRRPRSPSRAATRSSASSGRSTGRTAARARRGWTAARSTSAAGEQLTLTLAEPVGIGDMEGASGPAREPRRRSGRSAWRRVPQEPVRFVAPPAGTWSVEVSVRFTEERGSALYYWRIEVD